MQKLVLLETSSISWKWAGFQLLRTNLQPAVSSLTPAVWPRRKVSHCQGWGSIWWGWQTWLHKTPTSRILILTMSRYIFWKLPRNQALSSVLYYNGYFRHSFSINPNRRLNSHREDDMALRERLTSLFATLLWKVISIICIKAEWTDNSSRLSFSISPCLEYMMFTLILVTGYLYWIYLDSFFSSQCTGHKWKLLSWRCLILHFPSLTSSSCFKSSFSISYLYSCYFGSIIPDVGKQGCGMVYRFSPKPAFLPEYL